MKKKAGKKRRKRLILAGTGAILIVLAAGMAYRMFLSPEKMRADAPTGALSVNASRGSLSTTIVGSGQLQSAQAQKIQVPAGLSIEEVAVEVGDTVSSGDVLALVNETALSAEIAQIQKVISQLDGQLKEKTQEEETQDVTNQVEGRVKKIYAEAGDSVANVMVSDGALMLLSLDGKMAVQVETESSVSAGSAVSVVLSSGLAVDGNAENYSGNTLTVTLTDDGTVFGDTVTVKDSDGQELGTGTLFVHQPLEITGISGEISSIQVAENQWVEAEETLLTLADVSVSAEYQELLAVRTVYKDKLKELLSLADSCAIKSSMDGVIESIVLEAGSTTASTSSGDNSSERTGGSSIAASEMSFYNGQGTGILQKLGTNTEKPSGQPDSSADQEGQQSAGDSQTEENEEEEKQGEEKSDNHEDQKEEKEQGDHGETADSTQEQVNAQYEIQDSMEQTFENRQSTSQTDVQEQEQSYQQSRETAEAESLSESVSNVNVESSSFDIPDIQGLQEQVTGFTIAVQDHMILSVDIDELDILSVEEGQEVQITMDAAEGKVFSGVVSQVSDSTSGSDGSAKYQVEVTVPRDDSMRVGMSASATIVTEKRDDIIVVPADAVQERGRQVFVYTQYDPESHTLSGETEVQTGLSDGEKVEITSGLSEGTTVYYEKIEIQPSTENTQQTSGEGMFDKNMRDMNGDMNGGRNQNERSGGEAHGGGMPGAMAPGGQ